MFIILCTILLCKKLYSAKQIIANGSKQPELLTVCFPFAFAFAICLSVYTHTLVFNIACQNTTC